MRFVDEYAIPPPLERSCRRSRARGDAHFKRWSVLRAHAHDLPARSITSSPNGGAGHDRLPVCVHPVAGRQSDRCRQDSGFVFTSRRHGPCPWQWQPLAGQGRSADVRFVHAARCAGSRSRRPTPGCSLRRVRDDRTVDRAHAAPSPRPGSDQLQRLFQPRHHRPADQSHPRVARPSPRRVPRARPCVDRHRTAALSLRAGTVRQATGHRRLRAVRFRPRCDRHAARLASIWRACTSRWSA